METKKLQLRPTPTLTIVNFQNGTINPSALDRTTVDVTPEGNVKNISISVDGHSYSGTTRNVEGLRNFLVIRNKRTKKIRLVEYDEALLNNDIYKQMQVDEKKFDKDDYLHNSKLLSKTFGGKRSVRKLEQSEKLNVNVSALETTLTNTVIGIDVGDISVNAEENAEDSLNNILPPCHRDVKTIQEVYILYELISEEELNSLMETSEKVLKDKEWFEKQNFSEFFTSAYKLVPANRKQEYTCALLFVETLIAFLKLKAKSLQNRNYSACQYSYDIHNKIMEQFCIKSGNSVSRSNTMRDKAICHLVAISLIATNYQVDLQALSRSLSIPLNKLTQLSKALGAVPVNTKSSVFTLRLPIPKFSALKRGPGSGRRYGKGK